MDQTDRLLGRREVERVTSLSKAELYRRVREGAFPRQVRLGGRRVAWIEREVREWVEACVAERDQNAKTPASCEAGANRTPKGADTARAGNR